MLASHLAGQRGYRVTLIESARQQRPRTDGHRPANWIRLLGGPEDWNLSTRPDPGIAGRTMRWPRGRGLGGSSRINAMIWIDPRPADLDRWVPASGDAWKSDELHRSAHHVRNIVRPERPTWISESSKRFLAAAENGDGGQTMAYERVNRNGRRWYPSSLLEQVPEDRLRIVTGTVDRIVFDGDRATGVVVESGSATETVVCEKQVILSAGAIASPTILMRSGIGPSEILADHSIRMRIDSPGVGENLCDHLIMPVVFALPDRQRFPSQWTSRQVARWQTVRTGPLASNLAECGGLFADNQIQIHVTPTHYLTYPSDRAAAAMTIGVNATHPKSRGRLQIDSSRPDDPPRIDPMYLSNLDDLETTVAGVRLAREIASRTALADWIGDEILPGAKRCDDRTIAKSIARYSQTLYHPCGTCAMGIDQRSVVDARLSVKGTENLSVVDASVLPQVTTCNPNAAVMTIAHHFAERLLD
tara:strand:- start:69771 stop:71192 length:1422 start_codon:yes stop_codon:yes gene_type:complete